MAFTIENVQKLAHLARLKLTDAESARMQRDLSEIVKYVEQLFAIDVENISPMTHAIPMDLPMREDRAKPVIGQEGILGSQGFADGLVRVPKIIE